MSEQFWKVSWCDLQEGLNVSNDVNMCITNTQDTLYWVLYGDKIARVTIPDGARVIRKNGLTLTDRFILSDIVAIKDWCMWENHAFCVEAVKQYRGVLPFVKAKGDLCEEIRLAVAKQDEVVVV